MTAADSYPLLADFASRPSGHVTALAAKRREAREALDEINRLRAENAAFRNAIRAGDGPSCEDVCLVECVGACGITPEEFAC